ncbi:MAG: right-handed parallel beta-helix repeat-containing protein, partial [Nakamurella sp.]
MNAAQEFNTSTEVPTAAAKARRLGKLAAVAGLTTMMMLGTVAVAASASAAPVTIPVTQYAACTGGDDTTGLKTAIAALKTGDTLSIPAGVTCRHADVLDIKTPGVHLSGPGTLVATNEARSAVWLNADNITVEGGLTLKAINVTQRWNATQQHKLWLANNHTGITVQDTTIDGSAAAGIFINGASNFTLTRVTVLNSRADGIHMTNGSYNGIVKDATVRGAGDDGVAVVSYLSNPVATHDIQVINPKVYSNTWGRGVSVVGGYNITYSGIYVEASNAAAVYIVQTSAKDGVAASWDTHNVDNVKVLGGTLVNSNTNASVNNGAIVLAAGGPTGHTITNVTMSNLTIKNTRSTAARNVGIFTYDGGTVSNIAFTGFKITGGPVKYFDTNSTGGYSTTNWTVNGATVPNKTA